MIEAIVRKSLQYEETKQRIYEYDLRTLLAKKLKAGEVDLKRRGRVVCLMIPIYIYIQMERL